MKLPEFTFCHVDLAASLKKKNQAWRALYSIAQRFLRSALRDLQRCKKQKQLQFFQL